jgi:hypothetical protein
MTENEMNDRLRKKLEILLPDYLVMKHSDRAKSGWPDFSIVGRGVCSQWEVKLADPDFESPGIQELTCQRLSVLGYCRYIIFDYREPTYPCTVIVHPLNIKEWKIQREQFSVGLAFNMIAEAIRNAHMAMPYVPR